MQHVLALNQSRQLKTIRFLAEIRDGQKLRIDSFRLHEIHRKTLKLVLTALWDPCDVTPGLAAAGEAAQRFFDHENDSSREGYLAPRNSPVTPNMQTDMDGGSLSSSFSTVILHGGLSIVPTHAAPQVNGDHAVVGQANWNEWPDETPSNEEEL